MERIGLKDLSDTTILRLKSRKVAKLATGVPLLDEILGGGFRKDAFIHCYGKPGSGKSTFALHLVAKVIKAGDRALWVDCNGAFSILRLQALLGDDTAILKNLVLVRPTSFRHQTQILHQIRYHLDRLGLIVVDPITHFYRAERYRESSQGYFQELITQLGVLIGFTHLQHIPVLVTNYATVRSNRDHIPLVEKGFARVERYRLYFDTMPPTSEEDIPPKKTHN